jgi:class 3 adenylate cyclase/tetratricopeptide (TPR) repeat protein
MLPSGTVTFLFTDIEGSTRLFQQHPEAMKDAIARHHELVEGAIAGHRGHVFHRVGDGFCSVFESAPDALAAALAAQRALHRESWGELGAIRVRMGLHTGTAEARDGDYVASLTLARAQRVAAAGHGGQTLLSAAAASRVGGELSKGTTLRDLGVHKLRGLAEPETIFEVVAGDLPSAFPPLRSEDMSGAASSPLQRLVRGRLVGRADEARTLRQHWDNAQQARGHLVLVSGEPGVGKTRLAQDLIDHAQKAGATILRGGCYEYEATTPYMPFVEAFREWTRRQSPEQLRTALGATAPEIAKFAPEIETKLAPLVANVPLPPGEDRLRLFDNTARFLRSRAETGLLLFIDDIHWADQGTLSLLHYLLRHLREDRVLVLAAYRETELDRSHPLASALVEWNRERLATRVALGRLSRVDTSALLSTLFGQDSVSDDFTSALYRETEGNPFFIEEVVKALVEQGQIYREGDRWERNELHELTIPQSVKEAIGRRLSRLGESTVDALRIAAALGKIFPFRELAAVAATTEDALLDALDEASAAQLIRPHTAGSTEPALAGEDRFAFTHDKIREVLYEELNPIRRRRLHLRIGETLEKLYGADAADDHAQDLAHHFMHAAELSKSLDYARRAAHDAERVFAHDEALVFLEQAREAAEALQRVEDVHRIDEEMGDINEARGTTQLAVASYERALATAGDAAQSGAINTKIGTAYCNIGDPRGMPYLEAALRTLDPARPTNELAIATASMGRYHHYRSEHHKAIEFFQRARELAEPLDDAATLGQVYSFLAGGHQHLLLYDDSDGWARVSMAMGERKKYPVAIALGYEFLSENDTARGQWDRALAFAARNRDEGGKAGSLTRVAWSGFPTAQSLHGLGELSAARKAAEEALELSERIGEERLATWLGPMAAIIAADQGEDDAASAHADRAWARAQTLSQLVLTAWAQNALGVAALRRGDVEAALRWYEQYIPLVRDTENRVCRHLVMASAAEVFLRAGRLGEASMLAAQAVELGEFARAPHFRAMGRRIEAEILAAQQRYPEALGAFDDVIAIFGVHGSRLELARARFRRGALLLARGDAADLAEGKAEIGRAIDAFGELGALHDRALAERMASETGHPAATG